MNINIISDLRHLFCNIRPRNTLTCLMFATSDAHAGACPRWVPLSCQYVFCHTVKFDDGDPDQRCTLESMLGSLREERQPPENVLKVEKNQPQRCNSPIGVQCLVLKSMCNHSSSATHVLN